MIFDFIKDLIQDFLRWRRLDYDNRCVATDVYTTYYVREDGSKTGETVTHIVEFWIDGNDRRWTKIITSNTDVANEHGSLAQVKSDWRHHASLPENCKRVGFKPGKLVLLNGGATPKE